MVSSTGTLVEVNLKYTMMGISKGCLL